MGRAIVSKIHAHRLETSLVHGLAMSDKTYAFFRLRQQSRSLVAPKRRRIRSPRQGLTVLKTLQHILQFPHYRRGLEGLTRAPVSAHPGQIQALPGRDERLEEHVFFLLPM